MDWKAHSKKIADHTAMLKALQSGTATPEQQQAAFAHLQSVKKQHNDDLRDAERDARSAYSEGRSEGYGEARGDICGPGHY